MLSRDVLPAGGHLSFSADLSEAAELFDPIEPGGPDRELVAVLYAAPGVRTHDPDPPDGPPRDEYDSPIVLRERRVRPTARLQIRHMGFGYATRLLDFEILDGGDLLFYGPANAIRARDWEQLTIWPSSC